MSYYLHFLDDETESQEGHISLSSRTIRQTQISHTHLRTPGLSV